MKTSLPHLKDGIYLVTLLVGVAVMWGMTSTRIDYIVMKTQDKKLLNDMKVIPSEEVFIQHKFACCL